MSAPLPKVFVQDLPPKGGYPIIDGEDLLEQVWALLPEP